MDVDIEAVRSWLEVAAIIVGVFAVAWRWEKRTSSRLDTVELLLTSIKQEQEKQFGGNSGGIREKLNATADRIEDVSDRLDRHITQHVERGFRESA